MISFTTKRRYLKGIGSALLKDKATGQIVYQSDKFTTGSITPSADAGEITAGLGSPIATMIASNARVAVDFTAADFSLFAKAVALGARRSYGAPVPACQVVTATGTQIYLDMSQGTPVAGLGENAIYAYVLTVGEEASLEEGGMSSTGDPTNPGNAYVVDTATGAVTGFDAVIGTQYKVWYYVTQENAQLATITSVMEGGVYEFIAEFAVYANVNEQTLEGTRTGTFYVHIPSLKLAPGGAVNGDQTANDTTVITGQAITDDSSVVTAQCDACGGDGKVLAYYCYVPCDRTENVQGLVLVGGVLTVPTNTIHTIDEFRLLMGDGSLAKINSANMSYVISPALAGTSVEGSVLTTGATAGETEITATWTNGSKSLTCVANLSVVAGGTTLRDVSDVTAQPKDVYTGKTFVNLAGKQVGTMGDADDKLY